MYSALCLLLVLFAVIAYQYYVLREGFAVTPTTDELRNMVQGSINGNVDSYTALVNTGLLTKINAPDMVTGLTNALNDMISSTTPSLSSSLTSLTTSPPLALITAPTASSVKIADVSPLAAVAQGKQDQSKLLRDIQEVVHNEMMLTKQATTASSQPHLQGENDDQDCSESTVPANKGNISAAEQQGIEASSARSKLCPKDMNKYIRKDGIPCWGCTLDY